MIEPRLLPDEVAPDSSAPYPIIIAPSGAVEDEIQVLAAYASAGISIPFATAAIIPGCEVTVPAASFNRQFNVVTFFDVRALGGAGFGFSGIGYITSSTHPLDQQRYAVAFYTPSGASGSWRGSIGGHGQRGIIPAGEAFHIRLDMLHGSVGGTTHVDINSGWTGWLSRV